MKKLSDILKYIIVQFFVWVFMVFWTILSVVYILIIEPILKLVAWLIKFLNL